MTDQANDRLVKLLSHLDGFRELDSTDLIEIAGLCTLHEYEREHQIIRHHDKSTDVYFLLNGNVRAIMYSISGKQVTFQDLPTGVMFGELSAIDQQPRSTYIVAQSAVELAALSADSFSLLLTKHPELAKMTMRRLSRLVRMLCDKVFELSTLGVNNRIHAELLRRADPQDDGRGFISPAPTHAEIASYVSTHREAVTREFKRLSKSDLIIKQDKTLVITNLETLRQMVDNVLATRNQEP